jgi:hypothetical protein
MMNATVADQLVAEYLGRLDAALRDLPAARREELLEQVREHIATARAELGDGASEAEIRTLLDRLGDPATIAAEAGERPTDGVEPTRARPGWREIAVLVLLPIGGIVIPVIGWFVGVALLWSSDQWPAHSKLIGTLVVPGGLALPLALGSFATWTEQCSSSPTQVSGGGSTQDWVCTGGPPGWWEVLGPVTFGLLLLAPIATVIYLGLRLRREPNTAPAMS